MHSFYFTRCPRMGKSRIMGGTSNKKFYQIKIKSIKNVFDIYIPPQPYIEYMDFDFLLQNKKSNK